MSKEGQGINKIGPLSGEALCMSIPEAARLLGISRNFCYEMARQGEIPVIRLGNRILVPRAALEKMLDSVMMKAGGIE